MYALQLPTFTCWKQWPPPAKAVIKFTCYILLTCCWTIGILIGNTTAKIPWIIIDFHCTHAVTRRIQGRLNSSVTYGLYWLCTINRKTVQQVGSCAQICNSNQHCLSRIQWKMLKSGKWLFFCLCLHVGCDTCTCAINFVKRVSDTTLLAESWLSDLCEHAATDYIVFHTMVAPTGPCRSPLLFTLYSFCQNLCLNKVYFVFCASAGYKTRWWRQWFVAIRVRCR